MKRVRIGVIGCGAIAQIQHLPFLSELAEEFEVAVVCDVSPSAAEYAAELFHVPRHVTDYRDVLEELNLSSVGEQIEMVALFPQDETEAEVLRYVTYDPVHMDEIVRSCSLPVSTVSGSLAMMELKGLIKQVGGMNYIRMKEAAAEYQAV